MVSATPLTKTVNPLVTMLPTCPVNAVKYALPVSVQTAPSSSVTFAARAVFAVLIVPVYVVSPRSVSDTDESASVMMSPISV